MCLRSSTSLGAKTHPLNLEVHRCQLHLVLWRSPSTAQCSSDQDRACLFGPESLDHIKGVIREGQWSDRPTWGAGQASEAVTAKADWLKAAEVSQRALKALPLAQALDSTMALSLALSTIWTAALSVSILLLQADEPLTGGRASFRCFGSICSAYSICKEHLGCSPLAASSIPAMDKAATLCPG